MDLSKPDWDGTLLLLENKLGRGDDDWKLNDDDMDVDTEDFFIVPSLEVEDAFSLVDIPIGDDDNDNDLPLKVPGVTSLFQLDYMERDELECRYVSRGHFFFSRLLRSDELSHSPLPFGLL